MYWVEIYLLANGISMHRNNVAKIVDTVVKLLTVTFLPKVDKRSVCRWVSLAALWEGVTTGKEHSSSEEESPRCFEFSNGRNSTEFKNPTKSRWLWERSSSQSVCIKWYNFVTAGKFSWRAAELERIFSQESLSWEPCKILFRWRKFYKDKCTKISSNKISSVLIYNM